MRKFKEYFTETLIGNALTIILGVCFYLLVSNIDIVKTQFFAFTKIISPFIYAFAIAFVLNSPVKWFESKIFYKLKAKKTFSIIIVYIISFITISALIFAVAPQIGQSLTTIVEQLPAYFKSIEKSITFIAENEHISPAIIKELNEVWITVTKSITNFAVGIAPQILNISVSLGGTIINTLTAVIASIYMLSSKDRLIFQCKKILYAYVKYSKAERYMEIARRSNKIFTGFIIGKIIDSAIIGAICFVCMLFIYSPFAVLISVVVGVTNIIPFFGPFIGAIPCAFILLMVSPMTTLIFVIFIIILQQLDGNIIGPKILGDSTGLSALWVLVAIIVGNGLFGIVGMVIGVPTFAVVYSIVSDDVRVNLTNKNISLDSENYKLYRIEENDEIQ